METEMFDIDDIFISQRKRSMNEAKVEEIASSIASIGFKQPITVRVIPEMEIDGQIMAEVPILVVGLHRLLAMKKLGRTQIEAFVDQGSDLDAKMWEISENLHRTDLTTLERSEHIEEWRKLNKEKKGGQVGPPCGGLQPAELGVKETARMLGVMPQEVRRSREIAGMAPKAKEEAKALHLDDNQSALISAAKEKTAEEQIKKLQEIGSDKRAQQARITKSDNEINQKWRIEFNKLIAKASQRDLQWARERLDEPVADRSHALRIIK